MVRRIAEIRPQDIGSRQVTSEQLRDLVEVTHDRIPDFDEVQVRRFGHHDQLIFPVADVPSAVDDYCFASVGRWGIGTKSSLRIYVELGDGGFNHRNWLFRTRETAVVTMIMARIEPSVKHVVDRVRIRRQRPS